MNPTPIIFSTVRDLDNAYVTVYVPGESPTTIDQSHPNFEQIVTLCTESLTDPTITVEDVSDLFDIPKAVTKKFAQLSERVSVRNGEVLLDGDPVDGILTDQILEFLNEGIDFEPLVRFYEKLLTNPLGDVREALFGWIQKQTAGGNARLTITRDGDVIGYKSVYATAQGYKPSRNGPGIVNGVEGVLGSDLFQNVGDVVEMPRSTVLHDFSRACGDGLHVGTSQYAFGFSGDTKLAVRFNPRDVVSVPVSEGKIRVCRYRIEAVVPTGEAFSTALYESEADALPEPDEVPTDVDLTVEGEFAAGDRVVDEEGDEGTVVTGDDGLTVAYDDEDFGSGVRVDGTDGLSFTKIHGKGGPTSQRAKGNGRNPAQDEKGRFSNGRPGSTRDSSTGRFA